MWLGVVQAQSERARLAAQRHKRQANLGKAESLLAIPLVGTPPAPLMPFARQDFLMHAQQQLLERHISADACDLAERVQGGALSIRLGRCGRVLLDPLEQGDSSSRANGASEGQVENVGGGDNEAVNGVTSSDAPNAALQNSLRILMEKL